ncbi:hypothetical protein HOY82DRAFT_535921 [Tuber indicum]|nr:hypothetical protein HOY82DRAFT_535921 [Tuber indicum]
MLEIDGQKATIETEEQIVIQSIDTATDKRTLAQRLFELNQQKKLQKPLIGDLKATLHVYHASADPKDVESFKTTVLLSPADHFTGSRQFQISFQDILVVLCLKVWIHWIT